MSRGNTWNKQPRTDQSDYSISLKYGIMPQNRRTASDKLFQVLFVLEVGGADAIGTKDMEVSEREEFPFPISCRETCGFIQCFLRLNDAGSKPVYNIEVAVFCRND